MFLFYRFPVSDPTRAANPLRIPGLYHLDVPSVPSTGIQDIGMDSGCSPSRTDYNAALSDNTRVIVTHPFISSYGREYIFFKQYTRCGQLTLQCLDESENKIITIPATYTDYQPVHLENLNGSHREYFTIYGLDEAAALLENALKLSTE